jgi:hypothetical protein
MTPSARVQAAIEILDLVIAAARDNGPAADKIIAIAGRCETWPMPRSGAAARSR